MISAEELRELREAARRFARASDRQTADDHQAAMAAPLDRDGWTAMARLGLQGVRVPEELGGTGLDLAAELAVHEEMGAALYAGPFLPVAGQAVPALLSLADVERARTMLAEIAEGASVVLPADARWYDPDAASPVFTGGRDEGTLTGTVPAVLEGAAADGWLVPADSGGGTVLAWVRAGSAGAVVEPMTTVDLTRGFATLRLEHAAAVVLARGERAERAREAVERGGTLALAAECVGVASEALGLTVDYVKVREQFGQVIGAFQGVKHQVADLYVALESARSALAFAARSAEQSPPLRDAALAVARRRCGAAAFHITNEAIHLHGGIGFTWEHRLHLYYRRAKTNQLLLDAGGRQARTIAANVTALYAG